MITVEPSPLKHGGQLVRALRCHQGSVGGGDDDSSDGDDYGGNNGGVLVMMIVVV